MAKCVRPERWLNGYTIREANARTQKRCYRIRTLNMNDNLK